MHDPRNGGPGLVVRATCCTKLNGYRLTVEGTMNLRHLPLFAARLREMGCEVERDPLVFDLTADGQPICPRHRVAMSKRGKQGDHWYSHSVTDAEGKKHWCRGYAGRGSEGYHVEMVEEEATNGDA